VWGRSIEKNTPEREQRRHILGFEAEVAAHQIRRERDGELIARRKYFCMRPASGCLRPGGDWREDAHNWRLVGNRPPTG
jgi:hypothetical protein